MGKGQIYNIKRYKQLLDFSGLEFERGITPTDYDMVLDLGQTEWIVAEVKTGDTALPYGQRKCITNDLQVHYKQKIKTLGLIAHHNLPPEKLILVAALPVDEYWLCPRRGWERPQNKWTVREFIDKWRELNRSESYREIA